MRTASLLSVVAFLAACFEPQLTLRPPAAEAGAGDIPSVVPVDAATPPAGQADAGARDEEFREDVFGYLDASVPDASSVACTAGSSCEVENGCRRGEVACGPGGPVCVPLAAPFTTRATSCSDSRACDGQGGCTLCGSDSQPCCGTECVEGLSCSADGTCRTCEEGGACAVPDEPCRVGALSCGATSSCDNPVARERGVPCGDGEACDGAGLCNDCGGDGEACCGSGCEDGFQCHEDSKTCFACDLGAACVPANPCRLGLTACAEGEATCDDYLDAPRGRGCDDGKACDGFAVCESCGAAGQPCCETNCEDGLVCSATDRTCTACDAGSDCLSANGCRSGSTVCDAEGAAQCDQDSDVERAELCGDGLSCDGAGNCLSCGGVGEPCCDETCDAGNVCDSEARTCEACPQGAACLSDDGCDTGTIECGSGAPVCTITGFATRGTECGSALACDGAGGCETCGDIAQPCCDGSCGSEQRCSPELSCEGCPAGTVYVTGGTFQMGAPTGGGPRCDVADDDEAPVHEVTVEPVCADVEEVSVADYAGCDDCTFPTLASPGMQPDVFDDCHQPSSPMLPMNCVTWQEAADFCASRDMRLPTEAEWEFLARGDDGRSYPWGDLSCDDCSRAQVSGCAPGALPVGSLIDGASPFGLFDMAGNVSEWVADRYGAEFYDTPSALGISPRGPARGDQRVLRGGHYASDFASAASTERDAADPGTRKATVGLRCVRSMP